MGNFHTAETHQEAFELFEKVRSIRGVHIKLGIDRKTVEAWSHEGWKCPHLCPWHGWDRLLAERRNALQAKLDLVASGIFDPEAHDKAIRDAVRPSEVAVSSTSDRRRAVDTIVRSDVECLAHFEYLYNKVFFEATGLTLDHPALFQNMKPVGLSEDEESKAGRFSEEELRKIFGRSKLQCTNLSAAISTLMSIREHIDKLRESLGVKKKPLISAVEQQQASGSELLPADQHLSIEDLRSFRDLVEHTPPEQLELLRRVMAADDAQVRDILERDEGELPTLPLTVA